jgi:hypothetical protein
MKTGQIKACALAVALATVLAGCSSSGPWPLRDTIRTISTQIANSDPAARDARAVLTPAWVDAVEEPFLLVDLPSRQASATRALFAQRGPVQDWRGADGIAVILHDDVLMATRGLGADLLGADPVPRDVLRAAASGPYARQYRHLDGENREVVTAFTCRLRQSGQDTVDLIARQVAARRVIETCTPQSDGPAVINEYWFGLADGVIWKSKQWVGESVGYATLSHLKR